MGFSDQIKRHVDNSNRPIIIFPQATRVDVLDRSPFKKGVKRIYEELEIKNKLLTSELKDLEHKISLVKNNDLDYLDMLYREKFRYGTKDEIIIKLK